MAASLKERNKWALMSVAAGNLLIFYAAVQYDSLLAGDWTELAAGLEKLIPTGLGLALIGIINAQFSAEAKSRIVFMRWDNALPGCEAFSYYAHSDPRVDVAALDSLYGPLPTDPREQNSLWYKLYRSVEDHASVLQAHKEFLFARDYACLAVMMMAVLGISGFLYVPSFGTSAAYFALLLLQFVLASRAARNHGKRFVSTVLALKSAVETVKAAGAGKD